MCASAGDCRCGPLDGGPDVHPRIESEIHVIDVGDALAQGRRQLQIRLNPLEELVIAEMQERRVPVEQHHRIVGIADVHLRQPAANLLASREGGNDPRRQLRPASIDRSLRFCAAR